MSSELESKNLHLDSDTGLVDAVEFARGLIGVRTLEGRFTFHAPFSVIWSDGSRDELDPRTVTTGPIAHRLLDTLLGSHIESAVAGVTLAELRIAFDNGIRLELSPSGVTPHNWYAMNPDGVQFVGRESGELEWWGGFDEDDEDEVAAQPIVVPDPPEQEEGDGTEPREIDLDMNAHLFGVTVYGASAQLETRAGSIYLAGPFTVTDIDGEKFVFDPENLVDDEVAGAILAVLIDQMIESAVLKPETSELTVTLRGGERLDWKARSAAQAQFSAKHHNGRQFWSRGDGTVYWYGGPQGTHPKFLVGGPRKGE